MMEDGIGGVLASPGDAKDLARCLQSVRKSKDLLARVSSVAMGRAREEFAWAAVGRRLHEEVNLLCDEETTGTPRDLLWGGPG